VVEWWEVVPSERGKESQIVLGIEALEASVYATHPSVDISMVRSTWSFGVRLKLCELFSAVFGFLRRSEDYELLLDIAQYIRF